jgi:hypothetical protein
MLSALAGSLAAAQFGGPGELPLTLDKVPYFRMVTEFIRNFSKTYG